MDFKKKKVLVAGMARSGLCAARLLCELGAVVTVTDMKEELPQAREALSDLPLRWALGADALSLAREHDMTVISPGIPSDKGWVAQAIAGGIDLVGELELGFIAEKGEEKNHFLAITGTNGKTTTTALTAEIFRNAGHIAYAVGNIGDPVTGIAAKAGESGVVVCEVSSFQLETVRTFRPKVSAVLNISEDHLNRHGTMEEYIRLKERIFENQRKGDSLILNYDDPVTRAMGERAACEVLYFSIRERLPRGAWEEEGELFYSLDGVEKKHICSAEEIRIPGAHNRMNALAASLIALTSGVQSAVVRHTLRLFPGVEHRIEFVREVNGVRFINDSKATNVDSALVAIRAMAQPTVLIAGGYDKKTDFVPLAKEIKDGHIFHVILIGETAPQIECALENIGYKAVSGAHTMEQAVDMARELFKGTSPGGSLGNVLLSPACASFDMFADYEERGRVFKEIVGRYA